MPLLALTGFRRCYPHNFVRKSNELAHFDAEVLYIYCRRLELYLLVFLALDFMPKGNILNLLFRCLINATLDEAPGVQAIIFLTPVNPRAHIDYRNVHIRSLMITTTTHEWREKLAVFSHAPVVSCEFVHPRFFFGPWLRSCTWVGSDDKAGTLYGGLGRVWFVG